MKYILEIKPEYEDSFKGVMILGAKDSNLFVDTLAVENLEQYTPVDIEKIYDKACTDGYNRGLEDGKQAAVGAAELREKLEYQKGLDDAWEAVRKIVLNPDKGGASLQDMYAIFGNNPSMLHICRSYSAYEVIEKFKAYEEKQKADENVKRGDVVRNKINGLTYIVTLASDCGYVLLGGDGNFATSCITNSFEKTGKHVDIDKILEEMRYDG